MVRAEGDASDEMDPMHSTSEAAKKNIKTIARLENAALHDRSFTDRVGDAITRFAGSGKFVLLHIVWFTFWLLWNTGRFSHVRPFDPFPFTFLTMIVSLEAIFLAIFVLISQNRMARHSDQRAHLDLQVNLLAEQEMTMMLKMLEGLCEHAGVRVETRSDELRSLIEKTDPQALMRYLRKNLPES